jgi:RsiW-degrading membrane proteinase PrsW (M82 family)
VTEKNTEKEPILPNKEVAHTPDETIDLWRNRVSLFFATLIPLVFVVGFMFDFFDNGKIDNSWLVLGLFIFGGALSGQAVEKIVNKFFG